MLNVCISAFCKLKKCISLQAFEAEAFSKLLEKSAALTYLLTFLLTFQAALKSAA